MPNFPPRPSAPNFGAQEGNLLPGWKKLLAETTAGNPEFRELWDRAIRESSKGIDYIPAELI